jgi:hypothetical protein
MDANAPKIDHPVIGLNQWWQAGEEQFLGQRAEHELRDVLRRYLENNSDQYEAIAKKAPNGPLAISYDRGKARSVPCRYDFILASPHFSVQAVVYPYEASVAAGSDHSMVVADLSFVGETMASQQARVEAAALQPLTGFVGSNGSAIR